MLHFLILPLAALLLACPAAAQTPRLSATEARMRDWARAHRDEQIAYLARVVDIPSGTMNAERARRVGAVFRASPRAIVQGDLRTLSDGERDSARAVMREIVARSLPETQAAIAFDDGYPSMSPTPGNTRLLGAYSAVSEALGYGKVEANDPVKRGAGDISFVAAHVAGALDGLGAGGGGDHSPEEIVSLNSLVPQTQRAAVLIARLARERAAAAHTQESR